MIARLAIALLAVGCASTPPVRLAETVTPVGGGKFWAAGTNGMAVYYDGAQFQTHDYPLNPKFDRELYDMIDPSVPVAQVAIVGGEPLLFVRVGDVFRWSGSEWQKLPIDWPSEGPSVQIDRVFSTQNDSLYVQIHPETIVHGSLSDFRAGRFGKGATPSYLVRLELVNDHLFALGYGSDGNTMMGFEQAGSSWQPLGRVGRESINRDRGVMVLANGAPLAVMTAGLIPLSRDANLGNLSDFVATFPFDQEHTPYWPDTRMGIGRVFVAGAGRALLISDHVSDRVPFDIVEVRGDRAFAWLCNPTAFAIGAFPLEGGWRMVEAELDIVDIPSSRCRPAKKQLIRAE